MECGEAAFTTCPRTILHAELHGRSQGGTIRKRQDNKEQGTVLSLPISRRVTVTLPAALCSSFEVDIECALDAQTKLVQEARSAKDLWRIVSNLQDEFPNVPDELMYSTLCACRSVGEWRRCITLLRTLRKAFYSSGHQKGMYVTCLSVAIGACARWGAAQEAWELVDMLEEFEGHHLSLSALCRLWLMENSLQGGAGGGRSKVKKRVDNRERVALLVYKFIQPSVVELLFGHPGPAWHVDGGEERNSRSSKLELRRRQKGSAHDRGILSCIVNMLEDAEKRGYVDLHGLSVVEAKVGVEVILRTGRENAIVISNVGRNFAAVMKRARNKWEEGGGDGEGQGVGEETVEEQESEQLRSSNLLIITGKGLHSPGGEPLIKPAIMSLAKELEMACEELQENSGCLLLTW
eukprot:752061-Hanusia_phi.AAC.3